MTLTQEDKAALLRMIEATRTVADALYPFLPYIVMQDANRQLLAEEVSAVQSVIDKLPRPDGMRVTANKSFVTFYYLGEIVFVLYGDENADLLPESRHLKAKHLESIIQHWETLKYLEVDVKESKEVAKTMVAKKARLKASEYFPNLFESAYAESLDD